MSENDMNRRRVELPPPEQMIFEVVRREVEKIGKTVIAQHLGAGGVEAGGAEWFTSRCLVVFEAGLNEFDRQRRLYSDARVPRWRERVRRVMAACADEVFRDSLDDGFGGSRPEVSGPPGTPGRRRTAPFDDDPAPLARSSVRIARRPYIATREELAAYALSSATRQVRRRIRTWNDSELLDDMIEMVATRSTDKCLAKWDADSAPLLRYVDMLIKFAVCDELRIHSRKQTASMRVAAACKVDFEQTYALREFNELETDPLAHLVALDDECEYEVLRRRVYAAIDMLGEVQRAEVYRRLAGGAPGEQHLQLRFSRAVRNLRGLLGAEGDTWAN